MTTNVRTEHQLYPTFNTPFVDQGGKLTPQWVKFLLGLWQRTGGGPGGGTVITGGLLFWPGATLPDGYLLCDGRAVDRGNYSALFNAIGTTWGKGDGSSTFNLPDFRDFFLRGSDTPGNKGGGQATLTVDQLPAHTHVVDDPGHAHPVIDPGHVHPVIDPGHHHAAAADAATAGAGAGGASTGSTSTNQTGISVDSAQTGLTIDSAMTGISNESTGGGKPFDVVPKYASVLVGIKT